MKIGIDCRTISDPAGVGTYTRELVRHLLEIDGRNEYVLFFYDDFSAASDYVRSNAKIMILPPKRFKKFLPLIYSHYWLASALARQELDVCLFPANVMPLGYHGKAVLTIHDLAVYILPELFPNKLINLDRRLIVPRSINRAEKIIAVSNSTKSDIRRLFSVPVDRIAVVYEGVNQPAEPDPKSTQQDQPYFLFIGTIEPRKNIKLLVESFKSFVQSQGWSGGLLLAGGSGWKNAGAFAAIGEANRQLGREAVRHLGYISAEEKRRLLSGALALIYPTLYEGFGLPVLEAMAAGIPVITSNNSSLPEIAGDCAVLVNPNDGPALTAAMAKIASGPELCASLSAKGQKKSQAFTWEKCARETLEALESV